MIIKIMLGWHFEFYECIKWIGLIENWNAINVWWPSTGTCCETDFHGTLSVSQYFKLG